MCAQLYYFFGCAPQGLRGISPTQVRGACVPAGSVAGRRRRLAGLAAGAEG
jgi:hypothetical protein